MASTLRLTGTNDAWLEVEHGKTDPSPEDETDSVVITLAISTVSGGKKGEIVIDQDDAQALMHHLARVIPPPMFMMEFDEE